MLLLLVLNVTDIQNKLDHHVSRKHADNSHAQNIENCVNDSNVEIIKPEVKTFNVTFAILKRYTNQV